MKIFIANTYSILNLSDAGIVLAQIQFLRAHFPYLHLSLLAVSSSDEYFRHHRKLSPGLMFILNYLHIKLAIAFKKPVIFFPQSFDPLRNKMATHLLRGLLKKEQVQRIYAREQQSMDYLFMVMGKTQYRLFWPSFERKRDPRSTASGERTSHRMPKDLQNEIIIRNITTKN